jgi:hypothetical protein
LLFLGLNLLQVHYFYNYSFGLSLARIAFPAAPG